eukprot:gene3904-31198_t
MQHPLQGTPHAPPRAADLYLVPMLTAYGPARNVYCDRARYELAVAYVRRHHPWWDRSGGRDHVFWFTGDKGACG